MGKIENGPIPWAEVWKKVGKGKNEGVIPTTSGLLLRFKVGIFEETEEKTRIGQKFHQIRVEDLFDHRFQMGMRVYIPDNTLMLNMHTRGFLDDTEQRHPTMFASRFVPLALGFLRDYWQIEPSRFVGHWKYESDGIPSDNLTTFNKYFASTKDPIFSANQTWSAGVMRDNGFDGASHVLVRRLPHQKEPSEVYATFPKKVN